MGAKPIDVATQEDDGYPENLRFMRQNVAFVSAHVVGSNNNYDPERPSTVAEYEARSAANLSWLQDSFQVLGGANAFVVVIHADIFFPKSGFNKDMYWHEGSP